MHFVRPACALHAKVSKSKPLSYAIDVPEPSAAGVQQIQGYDFGDLSLAKQHKLSITQATHTCENLARVDFERFRYIEELNDVHATFTALILGHERLRAAKRFGNLGLG
ncbi:mll6109 [Mesorhizobium japonicum MAFF 303099]|uniref:Mll6109 protein n=1 Tax=Mesorhizobium japonicum (strain LMG 29417 / CECT 9101 / MAFF 303099) TaxID=266835 RepID=Q98A84_RHILO|nr:mll6109 [Mesorhizobium japonicum MAFF 303099]